MNRKEANNLSEQISTLAKTEKKLAGAKTSVKLVEDMQGNVTEGIVWMSVRDERSGNGACHEFRGVAPSVAEIIAAAEKMNATLARKAKEQRAEASAIRADAR